MSFVVGRWSSLSGTMNASRDLGRLEVLLCRSVLSSFIRIFCERARKVPSFSASETSWTWLEMSGVVVDGEAVVVLCATLQLDECLSG